MDHILVFTIGVIISTFFLAMYALIPLGIIGDLGDDIERNVENEGYVKAAAIHINDKSGEASVYGKTNPSELSDTIPACTDSMVRGDQEEGYALCLQVDPEETDSFTALHGYDFEYVQTIDTSGTPLVPDRELEKTGYYRIVNLPVADS